MHGTLKEHAKAEPVATRGTGIEKWFDGLRVVIIAGGSSVTLPDIHAIAQARLRQESDLRVIAINDAIFPAFWADWVHACDARWWEWHYHKLGDYRGIRTTLDEKVPEGWAMRLKNTGQTGFDEDPANCRTGSNGAYQAMHSAIHAGVREICLVGVDMDLEGHWHPPREGVRHCDRPNVMLPKFESLAPALAERGIGVVNASQRSLLEVWPKASLESFLQG